MKNLLIFLTILAFGCTSNAQKSNTSLMEKSNDISATQNFYDLRANDINGNEVDFSEFKGKNLLIVNVASKCGYTPQYEDLQKLYEQYGDKVTIIGFPANNFGRQEPGTNEEIMEFCSSRFGVTFPMMEKISVKGADKHPVYRWLSDKDLNGWNDKEPSWNFCKYFINSDGELVEFFPSSTKPMDKKILDLIKA